MDPRDRPSDVAEGVECASCGRPFAADAIRVLATRDDLLFAEGLCVPCGSVSLAIVVVAARWPAGDARPASEPRTGPGAAGSAGDPPIDAADVFAVRELLDGWTGDLRSLVGSPRRRPDPEAA